MITKLISTLEKAADSIELVERINKETSPKVRLWGQDYSVQKWNENQYKQALKSALKIFNNNNADLVANWFSGAVAEIAISIDKKSTVNKEATDLIETLSSMVRERQVCIPIQGLDLRVNSIDLGFGTLYKSTQGILPTIIEDSEALGSYQHKTNALNNCRCYFQVQVNSDHEEAISKAKLYTEYLISLLSLHIGSSQYREWKKTLPWYELIDETENERKRKISIWGTESGSSTVYYEFSSNESDFKKSEYELEYKYLSAGHDTHEAVNEALEFLRPGTQAKASYHLINNDTVNSLLCKNNALLLECVNNIEPIKKSLFQSVNWFGKAVNSDSNEEQFLSFAISLECLLTGKEETSIYTPQVGINQKISERAAFLLSHDLNGRLVVESEVKDLYGIRSKIVHSGENASNADVLRIEKLTRNLIFKFSERRFQSFKEISKWIKHKQYG